MKTADLLRRVFAVMLALMLAFVPFMYFKTRAEAAEAVDLSGATVISFSENGITAEPGNYFGYTVEENEVKIDESGVYVLRGDSSDASVKVKKETTGVVLVLDGLTLKSSTSAPITCAKSTEVTIIAAAGTVNTLSDTELNNDETHADNLDAENAVIKCKDGSNVVITGEGTLNIIANGKNGIKGGLSTETEGESSLTVRNLTLNIKANVNDALKSDTLLNVESGNITIEAADDAIKSDYVLNIGTQGGEGPTVNIVSSNEGIEAATLNVYSGNITVNSTDDGINAANSDLTGYSFECNFYGGKVIVNTTTGDGIDSNGSINFAGGEVEVYSSTRADNSPFDADGEISLSSGTVFGIGLPGMGGLPSGVEQAYVVFGSTGRGGMGGFGGRGGFNGGNGDSSGGMGGFSGGFGGNGMQPPTGENGTAPQFPNDGNGGMMQPPTDESGNAMQPPTEGSADAESGATQRSGRQNGASGGFYGGMGDLFGGQGGFTGGAQSGIGVSISEGDEVSIVDSNGSEVYSVTAKRSASYVFLSSELISEGETYILLVNGEEAASAQASLTASAAMGGFGRGGRNDVNGSAANDGAANGGAGSTENGAGSEAENAVEGAADENANGSTDDSAAETNEGTSGSAISLVKTSNTAASGTVNFGMVIGLVLIAVGLIAVGCVVSLLIIKSQNSGKLMSSKDGEN